MQVENIREKFGRFRILIVGRANAGKTTILKQICNSTENPVIYDRQGSKVDPAQIEGSVERGIHDIRNEMIFESNPNFVFHDSQGFEAGTIKEFEMMKDFVAKGAKTSFLKERIHAIWYCIPMDQYHRAVLSAEERFFDECETGDVPVVVVFTKCDALQIVATSRLAPDEKKLPPRERRAKVEEHVENMLRESTAWERLKERAHPPQAFVEVRDLHKFGKGCNIILEKTAAALNEEALKKLFVTTQKTNIMLCIQYAISRALLPQVVQKSQFMGLLNDGHLRAVMQSVGSWFPHTEV